MRTLIDIGEAELKALDRMARAAKVSRASLIRKAVDDFIANMNAYPGRTMGQLYHTFFRVNDLADGKLELGDHAIDLANVRVPVLAIAGDTDALAPQKAVHHVGTLLTGAPEVQLKTGPGGHLGVLTGRAAARTTWRWIDEFFAASAERSPRGRGSEREPAQGLARTVA